MTNLKKLADPDSFGPGAWLVIHTLAFHAKTEKQKRNFEESMHVIQRGLKCESCRRHCGEYLEKHPIKDYWNVRNKDGEDIGMFKWTWAFHNAVNTRLHKPVLDWETAYHLFSDSENALCTKECGGGEETLHSHSPETPQYHSYSHRRPASLQDLSYRQPKLIRLVPTQNIIRPYNYNQNYKYK